MTSVVNRRRFWHKQKAQHISVVIWLVFSLQQRLVGYPRFHHSKLRTGVGSYLADKVCVYPIFQLWFASYLILLHDVKKKNQTAPTSWHSVGAGLLHAHWAMGQKLIVCFPRRLIDLTARRPVQLIYILCQQSINHTITYHYITQEILQAHFASALSRVSKQCFTLYTITHICAFDRMQAAQQWGTLSFGIPVW